MIPILILRPEPGCSATADRARRLGLSPVCVPLFAIQPVAWVAPPPVSIDAVLMTSANAARQGGDQLRQFHHHPLFAVGPATARAAEEAGFANIIAGIQNGQAILDEAAHTSYTSLLWLAGQEHQPLSHPNINLLPLPVYASEPLDPSRHLLDKLRQPCIALIHSARAGQRFAQLAGNNRQHIQLVAISTAAAHDMGGGWRSVSISRNPDDAAMLALALDLCQQGQ